MKIILVLILVYFIYISPTIYYRLLNKRVKKFHSDNEIALTFDDGIDKVYTEKLLDLLYKYNIKATFFILSSTIEKNPQILKRMENEGHLIALHSLEHKCSLFKGYFYTKRDFEDSIKIFKENNIDIKYFRPPWGVFNLFTIRYIKKNNLKIILWNVMVGDWKSSITSEDIERKLMKKIKAGSIICLHDGRGKDEAPSRTIEALKNVIPLLKEKNYKFITMEKIYG
jgi:peptidoglycan/xylan/chitin deacetylase (PgdA/CDA1 family)